MEPRYRILYLEDNQKDFELLRDFLNEEGVLENIVWTSNRHDFEAALRDGVYDIILLDYNLPDFDCLSALTIVLKKDPDIPVVVISGTVGEEIAIETLKEGAADYVLKNRLMVRLVPVLKKTVKEAEEKRKRKATEQALIAKERQFRTLFNNASASIFICDVQGTFLEVNDVACQLLGYTREELLQMTPRDITQPELAGKVPELIREMVEKHHLVFETVLCGKGRNFIFVENSSRIIEFNGQDAILTIARDITERKQAEENLRKTRDHLNNIIESSLDSIIVSDNKGHITRANQSLMRLTGYEKEEIIGKPTMELSIKEEGTYEATTGEMVEIGEEYFNNAREMVEKLFKKGEITNWKSYFLRKDRKIVPVEANMALLYNEKGEVIGSIGINRDVTEREKAEKQIKDTKEFLEHVIESSKDGIAINDTKGYIISTNAAMERMTKFSREELIGMHSSELVVKEKEVEEYISDKIGEFLEKGYCSYESKHTTKDGSIIDVEGTLSKVKDSKGNHIASVAILRDLTEKKEMEHKFFQSEKLKSLGELAGGVSHDFNNVLAAILGRAQLLKMIVETPPEKEERRKSIIELKEGLEIIEKASIDGAETVRSIQEFSRRREDDKHFTTIDLNEIIDNALEFTRVKWKSDAESKGIKIKIQKAFSTLPTISGSAAELREVFTNLINNAVDAMPQGGEIKIKTYTDNSHIAIRVEDTGIGIPKDLRDRIFDPFFTTKGVESTGLGMSVSYGIINRHRGTISIDSIEGQGTAFTIKLPISEKITKEEKAKRIKGKPRKSKILVIEDEKEVRNLLSAILKKGGHEVEVVFDGSQGIEMFNKKEFDLVFTDLGMPGLSGWQVAEEIKGINGRVPVVLITGWNIEVQESAAKDKWVDLIIQKPFGVDQVLNIVQEGMILRDRFKAS